MIKKIKILLGSFYFETIILFFSIFILQVNAETKIIAKDGDTLLKLSKRYEVPLKELMHKNNINDANRLLKGEVILIPQKSEAQAQNFLTYKVVAGDTLYKISKNHNVSINDIILINNLDNSSLLKPNQIILLPADAVYKKVTNQKNIKFASKKVFYHQTSSSESLEEIASIHRIPIEQIITLNNLNSQTNINPNTKLLIRNNHRESWLKYGSIILNWSGWRYLDENYITLAKNKRNKTFYIAINCNRRAFNNTLNNSNWTNWYFPKSDFEYKLINDFCDKDFKF